MNEEESIEIAVTFTGSFSITESGLSRKKAIKDAMKEWLLAKGNMEKGTESGNVDVDIDSVLVNGEEIKFVPNTEFEEAV